MIEIKSYFKKENEFISCSDFVGPLKGDIDSNFEDFEGAIELVINGKILVDKRMWDYVDQLWRVFLDGLAYLRLGKHYIGYFPDQAIEITFVNMNDFYAEIKVNGGEEVRAIVEKKELFDSFLISANLFFQQVQRLLPEFSSNNDIKYIEAIRNSNLEFLLENTP